MKFLKGAFLFICISGFSQTKVGTIDIEFILSKMPELTEVQSKIETYGKQLDGDLTKKLEAYDAFIETYKTEETTLTIAQKQEKQNKIIAMEDDINNFQQNGSKLIGIKRDEVLRPLYKKIGESLEKIAKEQAYTQVLRANSSLVYVDSNYDLTLLVLKEMGITITKE